MKPTRRPAAPLMDVHCTALPNGLRVITSAVPGMASVALGLWVGAGARHESKRISGVSHFLEHLLFKGTETRSARAISMAIEGRGGYLNAFTQEESTCFYARVPAEQLTRALDVLTDMVLHSRLDEVEIERERNVILEEIMMCRDQPEQTVHEVLDRLLWQGHALGRPVTGSSETVSGLTRADMFAYMDRRYAAANTVVAFAGKVEHEDCVEAVRRFMGDRPRGRSARCGAVTEAIRQQALAVETREIEQTHLALGIRLFGRDDPRRHVLRILNTILGENMSSRLFQVVREKHGLAYSIQSSCHLFRDTGVLCVSAGLDAERSSRTLELTLRELVGLKAKPVGARELTRAKDYAVGQIRLGLESTTNQMMWVGDNLLSFGRFVPPEETIDGLLSVTQRDIVDLAESILRPESMSLAIVSPVAVDRAAATFERLRARI